MNPVKLAPVLVIVFASLADGQIANPAAPTRHPDATLATQPNFVNSAGMFGRGDRYGEVILVHRKGFKLNGEVWATAGLNDCPENAWRALDPNAIRANSGAMAVVLNGPRYFLPNSVSTSRHQRPQRKFGDLEMRRVASVEIDPRRGGAPYTERTVQRTTTFFFNRGEEIYQLTSPDGHIYVMQSMSQIVDPNLTLEQLPSLATRLKLPRGWKYEARKLDSELQLVANRQAVVLQDDLSNTYQRR